MKLVEFKNFLHTHDIELFDHQLRLAHFRIYKLKLKSEQMGGANVKKIKNKINNMTDSHLLNFIYAVLDKNAIKIKWILDLY